MLRRLLALVLLSGIVSWLCACSKTPDKATDGTGEGSTTAAKAPEGLPARKPAPTPIPGPFGVPLGKPLPDEVRTAWVCSAYEPELICSKVPKPLEGAFAYSLGLDGETVVRATSVFVFQHDEGGVQARQRFTELEQALGKYGQPHRVSRLPPITIYRDSIPVKESDAFDASLWLFEEFDIALDVTIPSNLTTTLVRLSYQHNAAAEAARKRKVAADANAL